ncbi:MAG TPA: 1-(5-phosphoribosyl)-5-[(5-phosphoribosylamino)methylideneamino]imidazole-4-carboxamide isomerase [Nitrospiraceae bacterium]|nr:1-(5-phosphoribosyl)-5-[(5-phosphoribosylamino)methylideneamino]imidazole-4-carboxamide isomerase [Nitrospiraceae bacterium]
MQVIPAIDIKDGRCVRLRQGDMAQETVYSDDLVSVARGWRQKGAAWLHVVDLNGAVDGKPSNDTHIEGIVKAVDLSVQVGGGIRSIETVRRYFQIGVARVVLGTAALTDRSFLEQACREFPGRVLVGVDARNGKVAVQGWTSISETAAVELIRSLEGLKLAGVVYTDIARDGMLAGPNLQALKEVADHAPCPVIASGGVTRVEDLVAIRSLGPRLEAAIVGKALYDGKLDFAEAILAVRS